MKSIKIPKQFGYTSDHDLLRKTARRMLEDKCPMTEVRRLVDDETGYDAALWNEIAELGWTGLVTPEKHGGAELDFLSLALLLEETGRVLLPAPLTSSLFAGIAVDMAGDDTQRAALLPGLASGETIATVALTEPKGSWEPHDTEAWVRAAEGGFELSGTKTHVLWGANAQLVVAPFRMEDGSLAVFAFDPSGPGIEVTPEVAVDSTRRTARIELSAAPVAASAKLANPDAWQAILSRGYALLAAEMVGAAQGMLAQTIAYAKDRTQFKRQIGSFQGVKHPIVNVMIAVEQARSLAYAAASIIDTTPEDAEVVARMAKVKATQALRFSADRGVQFHGGYGFTWDCDAHFFYKRSIWSAATLGDAIHHKRHLADAMFE